MSKFHDEFFAQKGQKHDELVMKCVSNDGQAKLLAAFDFVTIVEHERLKCDFSNLITNYKYETEVLCKSGNSFIIGYADLIFSWEMFFSETYVLANHPTNAVRYVIEAKPELTDVGAVLRQLKTYKATKERIWEADRWKIVPVYMAIATYSSISDDVRAYLEHEGVKVVTFDTPGVKNVAR
ncbi:MAG: hypothetical protein WAW52_05440 [Methanothrix sp.]